MLALTHIHETWERRRRQALFPDWLAFLAPLADLGIPFAQALAVAADAVEEPLRTPALRLARAVAVGVPAEVALREFALQVDLPEAHVVADILARSQYLGSPITSLLVEEEGMLARLRWKEREARQGVLPYAFTASAGALLVNAAFLFLVPRVAALLSSLHVVRLIS
jgi:Flp pilus assembly protein TadB